MKKHASLSIDSAFMHGFATEIIKTAGPTAGRLARMFSSASKAKDIARPRFGLAKGLALGGGAAAGGGLLGMSQGKKKGYESGTDQMIGVAQQARQLGRREGVLAYHQALQAKMQGGR
jgi:hypothetical protein